MCRVEENVWNVIAEVKYQNLLSARVSVSNTYVWHLKPIGKVIILKYIFKVCFLCGIWPPEHSFWVF